MRLPFTIEPDPNPARYAVLIAPVAAVLVTSLTGVIILSLLDVSAGNAIWYLFLSPFSSRYNIGEIFLKMTPLLIVAQGLAIGFRANVWNIGGEGQIILGAIGASLLPVWFNASQNPLMLPGMILIGTAFGMAWAAIAALLRTRFNANEILVTLMLNSIALQLLFYLVSGPLRDPFGFNFPQSALFPPVALLPEMFDGMRINVSIFAGLLVTAAAWLFVSRSMMGFRLQVGGLAPGAARYAGFRESGAVWLSLLIGGAAAGLVGVFEAAGPLGQLQREVTSGYGFAAIIVAFLGGLNAIGILFAAFFMAVIFVGGDIAQTSAGVPYTVNTVLQGVLLVTYIAARLFAGYRLHRRGDTTVSHGAPS